MVRKCGFFDCTNPATEKDSSCQVCNTRKEQKICSACRQPEKQAQNYEILKHKPSLVRKRYPHQMATVIRDKLPASLQTKLDQLLLSLKLTASEQELIVKLEKFLAEFLAKRGGKQDHID